MYIKLVYSVSFDAAKSMASDNSYVCLIIDFQHPLYIVENLITSQKWKNIGFQRD